MNTGIQDACNLAWKLALVTRGICREDLLNSYSSERSAIAKVLLEATGRATTMAVIKSEIGQSIRNHAAELLFGLSSVRELAANVLSEISIGYPNSPLSRSAARLHNAPKAGERAPIRQNEKPVGAGDTPRFALFASESSDARAIMTQYQDFLEMSLREPYANDGMWVVRPDGYIGLVTKNDDFDSVYSYLRELATPTSEAGSRR